MPSSNDDPRPTVSDKPSNDYRVAEFISAHPFISAAVIILTIGSTSIAAWQGFQVIVEKAVISAADHEKIADSLKSKPEFAEQVLKAIQRNPDVAESFRGPPGPQGPKGEPGPMGRQGPRGSKGPPGKTVAVRNDSCEKICQSKGKTCSAAEYVGLPVTSSPYGSTSGTRRISCSTPLAPNSKFDCECK